MGTAPVASSSLTGTEFLVRRNVHLALSVLGKSRTQLAREMGVPEQSLGSWLRTTGRVTRPLRLAQLDAIAVAIGVPVVALFDSAATLDALAGAR